MPRATCHTQGCTNAGIPVPIAPPVDIITDEPVPPPWTVLCGACGEPITDITEEQL